MIEFYLDPNKAKSGTPLMTGDIGYDEYAGTLSPLGYVNLMALKEAPQGTFRYIRIHNIFTSKEGDHRGARDAGGDPVKFDANGNVYYDWTIPDAIINSILHINSIPFIELGFSPTPFSTQATSTIKPKKNGQSPANYPPQLDKWEQLLIAFLEHIIKVFGDTCKDWPFELWNEPDIGYFKEPVEVYCRLWERTWRVCKDKGIKILGGPAVAGTGVFFEKFLRFAKDNLLNPDFISYHAKCGSEADSYPSAKAIWTRLVAGKEIIDKFPEYRQTPIWITEFDDLVGCELGMPDNHKWEYRNTHYYASWLGKMCCMLTCLQQSIMIGETEPDPDIPPLELHAVFNDAHHITAESTPFYGARCLTTPIWINTNIKDRYENEARLSENLSPLLNVALSHQPSLRVMMDELISRLKVPEGLSWSCLKAIPKPIFRAFEYTRFLKGKYVPIINEPQHIYGVLAINNETLDICITNHSDTYKSTPEQPVKISIPISGKKLWKLTESVRIDEDSANPYQVWEHMNYPTVVTPAQFSELENATHPKPANVTNFQYSTGLFSFVIHLKHHSFQYLRFDREKV